MAEQIVDKTGDALIAYLDSPEFQKASTNATRLVNKLKTAIQKRELYETYQILRTVYFRFISNEIKVEALVSLLYYGAHYLIDNLESISGQDIAVLFIESSARLLQRRSDNPQHQSNTQATDICQKISNLAIKLPDSEMGQAKFIAEALKQLNPKILDRDLLHAAIASRYWQEKNYGNARYHFLHCANVDNAEEIAMLLVEYHSRGANRSEVDLFLTQFIFQLLCLQAPLDAPCQTGSRQSSNNATQSVVTVSKKSRSIIKSIVEKIFSAYTLRHPHLKQLEPPFKSQPLLNFTCFIISILDSSKPEHSTFKMLCDIYKTTWNRDPNYQSYLNRIGISYFGLADQNKQNQGGFLNNILMSLMDGTDEDEEVVAALFLLVSSVYSSKPATNNRSSQRSARQRAQPEEQSSCHLRELDLCLASVAVLTNSNNQNPITTGEINRQCKVLMETETCLKNFTTRCMTESQSQLVDMFADGGLNIIRELCKSQSKTRSNYLKYGDCINNQNKQQRVCMRDFQVSLEKSVDIEWQDRLKLGCCAYNKLNACMRDVIEPKCGAEAYEMHRELFRATLSRLPSITCAKYDYSSKSCGALLPPAGSLPKGAKSHSVLSKLFSAYTNQ